MTMMIDIHRYKDDGDATLGMMCIDGIPVCYTLEDEGRDIKIPGETCIPSGQYEIILRKHGGFHNRYASKFDYHEGMLELVGVPNFTNILIHIGNYERNTDGCILVGATGGVEADGTLCVWQSTKAYANIYPKILAALNAGETVMLTIYEEHLRYTPK